MHNQIVPTFLSAAFRSDMPEGIMTSGSEESVGREGEILEAVSYGQCSPSKKDSSSSSLDRLVYSCFKTSNSLQSKRRWEKESYHTQRHT